MGVISYTALDTFFRCPRKFKFSYIDRLTRQEFSASPMTMGSAIHAGLSYGLMLYHESNYRLSFEELQTSLNDMLVQWRETNKPLPKAKFDEYGNVVEDESQMESFFGMVDEVADIVYRTFVRLDINQNWRTVELAGQPLIEYRGQVPLDDDTVFQFQIDWVAQSLQDGLIYLVDWKSRRSFQEEEGETTISGEDFNFQMSLYQKAMQLLGVEASASVCFQISPHKPRVPDVLETRVLKDGTVKKGRVSKSNIRTDWETYAAAIIANGEDPDDPYYAEMKERLGNQEWFSPIQLYRSQTELDSRWQLAREWTRQIFGAEQTYLPATSPACAFCSFAKLCLGADRGHDVTEIIEREFVVKES